jgi:hypothetical protein
MSLNRRQIRDEKSDRPIGESLQTGAGIWLTELRIVPAAAIRMLPRVALEYAHIWCAACALQARQADAEARLKDASAASCAQVHFGTKGRVSRERNLHSHGTNGTGRPPSAKQLLRIRAAGRSTRRRPLDVQPAIRAAGRAMPATRGLVLLV